MNEISITQIAGVKIIGKSFLIKEPTGYLTEIIDPCEMQYMNSPQGLMISFLPLHMITNETRLTLSYNDIVWQKPCKESLVSSYKQALNDYKARGGKTEESDIIVPEQRIILK